MTRCVKQNKYLNNTNISSKLCRINMRKVCVWHLEKNTVGTRGKGEEGLHSLPPQL